MGSGWTVPIALAAEHSPPTTTTSTTTTTTTTTTTPPVVVTPTAAVRQAPVPPPTTTTTSTTTTTTTAPPPPPPLNVVTGEASWYGTEPGTCASPFLPFGTVVTVTDISSGGSIRCIVDDRQASNPGRVIDLSYSGFSQLASPTIGLIEVRVSW